GAVDLGKDVQLPARDVKVGKGDLVILAVDARDGNHVCDLTEVALTLAEQDRPGRSWDLAGDVADNVLDGNPHADRMGNKGVWSLAGGRATAPGGWAAAGPTVPPESVLGRWRAAAGRRDEAGKLAGQVRALLTGPRPTAEKTPDRILYDNLV